MNTDIALSFQHLASLIDSLHITVAEADKAMQIKHTVVTILQALQAAPPPKPEEVTEAE